MTSGVLACRQKRISCSLAAILSLASCGAGAGRDGEGTQAAACRPVVSLTRRPTLPPAEIPALTGSVVDRAEILSPQAEARLARASAQLQQRTSDQLVVVTLPDLHNRPISEVGLALGRFWGIGQRGSDNGVLILVAPNERKVRIEVGYGLESILTNDRAQQIIDAEMLPAFRAGRYEEASEKGARAVSATLTAAATTPRIGACR